MIYIASTMALTGKQRAIPMLIGKLSGKMWSLIHHICTEKRPVLSVEEMPEEMKKIGILHGYRPVDNTVLQCVASAFHLNTETVNFWSHFTVMWYYLWLAVKLSCTMDCVHDPYLYPLMFYVVTAFAVYAVSAGAHMFSGLSRMAHDFLFLLDYTTICCNAFATALVYRAYSYPEELLASNYSNFIIGFCFVCGVGCYIWNCYSRLGEQTLFKLVTRPASFGISFASGGIPVVFRSFGRDVSSSLVQHALGVLMGLLSILFAGLHFPEKLSPGRFNYLGNSHQLMHIASFLANFFYTNAVLLDLNQRREIIVGNGWFLSAPWSCGLSITFVTFIIAFLIHFVRNYSVIGREEQMKCKQD